MFDQSFLVVIALLTSIGLKPKSQFSQFWKYAMRYHFMQKPVADLSAPFLASRCPCVGEDCCWKSKWPTLCVSASLMTSLTFARWRNLWKICLWRSWGTCFQEWSQKWAKGRKQCEWGKHCGNAAKNWPSVALCAPAVSSMWIACTRPWPLRRTSPMWLWAWIWTRTMEFWSPCLTMRIGSRFSKNGPSFKKNRSLARCGSCGSVGLLAQQIYKKPKDLEAALLAGAKLESSRADAVLVLQGLKLSTEQKAAELQKVTVELSKSIREGSVVNFVDLLEKYESTVSWPVDELRKHEALKEVCVELGKVQSKQQSLVELGQLLVKFAQEFTSGCQPSPNKCVTTPSGVETWTALKSMLQTQEWPQTVMQELSELLDRTRSGRASNRFVCIYAREMAKKRWGQFWSWPWKVLRLRSSMLPWGL